MNTNKYLLILEKYFYKKNKNYENIILLVLHVTLDII